MNLLENTVVRLYMMKTGIYKGLILFLLSNYLLGCKEETTNPCELTEITIEIASIVPPSRCDGQDAQVVFAVSGGNEPYRFVLNTGSTVVSQNSGSFKDLFPGFLQITVLDQNNCSSKLEFEILNETPTGISYSGDITPILQVHCNVSGCHNGDLGADRDWRSITAIQNKLNNFQRVLSQNKMPPPPNALLSSQQVSTILCWIADGGLNN